MWCYECQISDTHKNACGFCPINSINKGRVARAGYGCRRVWPSFSSGNCARARVSLSERTVDRNSVDRYWDVRLAVERDLGLFRDQNG
jgi:hypothetical protein